jgi:N-acetylglucosaminyl-diphospho-decaprenol L-rhamnosyltransferase
VARLRGSSMADVAVVVVTYNALPWVEQCLASVADVPAVLVDHGSTDGTLELVRERFPQVEVRMQENDGLAAGWNRGIELTQSRYVLVLNADAWLVDDALERLVSFADAHPRAAVVGPALRNPDGTLQRSVRGFPTLWRLATEYFFLRKLAPRTELLNGFYAGGFDHRSPRRAEFVMGACMLLRRGALDAVGRFDEDFFLFSEEVDWCYRAAQAGFETWFTPDARCVHVGGASHGGALFRENLRGHLLFLRKHRGARSAERARRLLRTALVLRGLVFRGARGRAYRDAARWLGSADAAELSQR